MKKDFNKASGAHKPNSLTLRLSFEERTKLERDAAGMGLSAYVREKVFGADAKPRRTRGKFPVKDHQALARVLARLGRSEMAFTLNSLMVAHEEGRVFLDDEQARHLQSINDDIVAMRHDLMTALGRRLPVPEEWRRE